MNFIIKALEPIGTIIGGISTIAIIVELNIKLYTFFTQKRYIKTVLNFNKKSCLVSQATYPDTITSSEKVVTFTSMQSFQMINEMLYKVNYVINPYIDNFEGNNIIHIGGPAANIHVNALFVERKFDFYFCTSRKNEISHQKLNLNQSCLEYSDDNTIYFKIGNEKLIIEKNVRDYGIIIRIPYDRNVGREYSTHIIFGCWANGTLKAVEFFTKNHKIIAKKYKRSKYCFAVPINLIDNTIVISNNSIIDLTNQFFKE